MEQDCGRTIHVECGKCAGEGIDPNIPEEALKTSDRLYDQSAEMEKDGNHDAAQAAYKRAKAIDAKHPCPDCKGTGEVEGDCSGSGGSECDVCGYQDGPDEDRRIGR